MFFIFSLGGAPEGSICNISHAIKTATTNPNAIGLLLTNWAGCTYSNHPVLSWPAYISAAGLSWNASTSMVSSSHYLNAALGSLAECNGMKRRVRNANNILVSDVC